MTLLSDNQIHKNKNKEPHGVDCMECKIVGTLSFTGLSGYALYMRMNTPKHDKVQRIYLAGVAVVSFGLAVWRITV